MARPKSDFLSAFGTAFQVFKAVTDAVLNLDGSDDDVRRILNDQDLVKEIAKLIVSKTSEVFPIVVDYSQALADMIAAGKYNWVNNDITQEHFPITGDGIVELKSELVHFKKDMSTDNALIKFNRCGLRPATLPELLAFGAKYPEKQREFPIVALGSVWRHPGGDRRVPYLYGVHSERDLDLRYIGDDWRGRYRFLAFRK